VLRVSVVREIRKVFAWARTGATSRPNAETTAPPVNEALRKVRRETAISNLRGRIGSEQREYQSNAPHG
jgi:hypothetical protein